VLALTRRSIAASPPEDGMDAVDCDGGPSMISGAIVPRHTGR
jgi:hypothetical protein